MTRHLSFTLQIGTRFDGANPLIWNLMKEAIDGVVVPRPRRYRKMFTKLATEAGTDPASDEDLAAMFGLKLDDMARDLHCILRVVDLMEPAPVFCPAGDWFYDIGPRAAGFVSALAPAPVTFMISLCNPAYLLSEAMASGAYPGIEVIAPDPFDLHWAAVLRNIRDNCPDTPIIAWAADDAALIWDRVLAAATQGQGSISEMAKTEVAQTLMNEEGSARLAQYLDRHTGMTDALRAQVIAIFLKRFPLSNVERPEIALPGWDDAAQERMQQHFSDDLRVVAEIEGVTVISP